MFPAPIYSFFMVGLLRAMGVYAEPSLIPTPPGACGLSSLRDEVRTLPGGCAQTPVTGHPTLVGACSLSSLRDEVYTVPSGCAQSPNGWQWSCCCGGIPQSAPEGLFLFGKILLLNPVAPSVQGGACPLTQPTSPAGSGTVRVRVAQVPTFNSPQPVSTVALGFPLRPYSPPCDFRQPGRSQCCSGLVWQGRGPLTWLSPRSPAAGAGLGLQRPWSLC